MRTATKEYTVYKFEELSEDAKEKVKQWYLGDDTKPELFEEFILDRLAEMFPHSDLKVQFSLSSCQGDGVNIYGDLDLNDVLDNSENTFTSAEKKELINYITIYGRYTTLPYNQRYCYCVADSISMLNDIQDNLIDYADINRRTLHKFTKYIYETIKELCDKYETEGYEYFYEASDEEVEEWCDCNDYEFLEDGTLF